MSTLIGVALHRDRLSELTTYPLSTSVATQDKEKSKAVAYKLFSCLQGTRCGGSKFRGPPMQQVPLQPILQKYLPRHSSSSPSPFMS
ncbi:hypothetical protein Sjap_002246 [Stephania japonica]|uniref:Uncharacterized protein n=1 Tax=Stephania japonica TaxID=461633 RepID=A0AAP0PVY0_9MAGN